MYFRRFCLRLVVFAIYGFSFLFYFVGLLSGFWKLWNFDFNVVVLVGIRVCWFCGLACLLMVSVICVIAGVVIWVCVDFFVADFCYGLAFILDCVGFDA